MHSRPQVVLLRASTTASDPQCTRVEIPSLGPCGWGAQVLWFLAVVKLLLSIAFSPQLNFYQIRVPCTRVPRVPGYTWTPGQKSELCQLMPTYGPKSRGRYLRLGNYKYPGACKSAQANRHVRLNLVRV
eukprot:1871836-Rhodomonas_salina.1